MTDTRIILCPACGGDGYFDCWDSSTRCEACGGDGEVEIELEPIDIDDLDADAPATSSRPMGVP